VREKIEERIRICFWKTAKLMNKCEKIWKYLEKFDIVGLMESWIKEETWKKIRHEMSSDYIWTMLVTKEYKKGRAVKVSNK